MTADWNTLQPEDEAYDSTSPLSPGDGAKADFLDAIPASPSATPPLPEEGIQDVIPAPPPPSKGAPPDLADRFRLPRPPQPGFWLGAAASLLMLIVCQIGIPLIVIVIVLIGRAVVSADLRAALVDLQTEQGMQKFQNETAALLLVSAHVPMILFSLLALRIFAGKYWYREVAIRLPSLPHFLILVLAFPSLPILAGGAYMLAQRFIPGLTDAPALMVSQFAMIGVLGLIWLVGLAIRQHDPKRDLSRGPILGQLAINFLFIAVALATAWVGYHLVSSVLPEFKAGEQMDKGMEELVKETRNWSPILAVLIIAVQPAFSEELWCRAYLGRGLVGQYGVVGGVLITSYFFGAIHVLPHQGAMAMLMGIVLFYAYLTTRSLLAPMLLHFLNNGTSVLGNHLGEQAANVDVAPDAVPMTLYACAALLMVAGAWALYQSRARLIRVDGAPLEPWQPAYPGVALPPPGSGTAVSRSWPSWPACAAVGAAFLAFATVFTLGELGYTLP
jgi:membrane protease YdiL (CAAX protease family)